MIVNVQATGVKAEAVGKYRASLPKWEPGKHCWALIGAWRVEPTAEGGRIHLDMENLISIEGPGCMWCEAVYTPEIAARPCTGTSPEGP